MSVLASEGLITKPNNYSATETLGRLEATSKAHVWEDAIGKVWLSYNSSQHLTTIYERHGAPRKSNAITRLENALSSISNATVQ